MRSILLFLLCCMFTLPAHAEEKQFYIKKKIQTNIEESKPIPGAETETQQPDGVLPESDPLAILHGDKPQQPQYKIDESQPLEPQYAAIYFDNCMKASHPSLTPEGQESLCACTASAMQEEMTAAEIRVLNDNTNEGQAARDKMLTFIYAPCIRYPTHDLIYTRCIKDAVVASMLKKHGEVCACMADGMAGYVEENAPKFIASSLSRDPGNLDPLGKLLGSRAFEDREKWFMKSCVNKHELGIR